QDDPRCSHQGWCNRKENALQFHRSGRSGAGQEILCAAPRARRHSCLVAHIGRRIQAQAGSFAHLQTGRCAQGGYATGRPAFRGCASGHASDSCTSPGLEMCERSSLRLNSSADVRDEARVVPGSGCCAKYFLTRSASSTSMELECVFFSVTPTLMRASRIILLFTSSSLARSLIRIFCIPPYFLRIVPPG